MFDQLVVGVRDRRALDLEPAGVLDEDPVVTVRDDVLDALVVQQRLQSAQMEEAVEHCPCQRLLLVLGEHGAPGLDRRRSKLVEAGRDQLAGEHLLVVGIEVLPGVLQRPKRGGELLGDFGSQRPDQ